MSDTRAYAWCNLGPLAEQASSIADSHVQGSGVITVKGTVNLSGIYRPAPGTIVELAYSDGQNWIARLPCRLRVLSSFANPLAGKITSISVGCDLAYMEARKQPPDSLTTRQANPDTPEAVWRAAAPAIPASWLVGQILAALGLTAAGSIPLTNHYTRQEFDLTAGYVEELGKLASSEGYAVRMNTAGLVEFINKAPGETGTGPLLTEENLIDLNPINTGDLPGDAVYAKYTSLKLVVPSNLDEDSIKKRNWEREVSISAPQQYTHQWTEYAKTPILSQNGSPTYRQRRDANGQPVFWVGRSVQWGEESEILNGAVMDKVFEVKAYQLQEEINYITRTVTETTYDSRDRVRSRRTETLGLWGVDYSETAYTYGSTFYAPNSTFDPANNADVLNEVTIEFSAEAPLKMSAGYQQPYGELRGAGLGGQYQSAIRETEYDRNKASGTTKTVTTSYVSFISTPDGQEAISRLRDAGNQLDPSRLAQVLGIAKGLVSAGSETRISTGREFGLQRRPSEAERTAAANQKAPTVETTSEATWAVGSATSQTSIELSPPYVPDDRIVYSGGTNGTYSVIKSNADQAALHYARTENRLLLGHRNGNGIQVLPELLPVAPMGLVFIRLNGCTAAFRTNGTTYNIDPQGVTATTDCLFWGAVDGTVADAWFPLPPGATSLPAPVATTTNANPKPANAIAIPGGFSFTSPNLSSLFASLPSGQAPVFPRTVTPGAVLRPYHETVTIAAGGGAGAIATALPWIRQPAMEVLAGGGAGAIAELVKTVTAGSGSGVIASLSAETIPERLFAGSGSGVIADLSGEVFMERLLAGSGSGIIADLSAETLALLAGSGSGVIADTPVPNALLLHMDGSNGSTTFTDSSSNQHAMSIQNGAVTITTAQSKFGGASGEFNGRLRTPTSSVFTFNGDFTIELWARRTGSNGGFDTLVSAANESTLMMRPGGANPGFFFDSGSPFATGFALTVNTWQHVAMVRSGSTVTAYVDGVSIGAITSSATVTCDFLMFGDSSVSPRYFKGQIDEVRVTNGKAHYTSAFIPPSAAFPNG
jgi:hypothetical protein